MRMPSPPLTRLSTNRSTVRWRMVTLLTVVSFVSYVERMNISVAAKFIAPEFGLSQIQIGQVFSSFMLGYAMAQIPAGRLGDVFGPRLVLTVALLWWGVATLLTGLLPGVLVASGLGVFLTLVTLRFLLGVGEATTYPVAARTIANWMPDSQRATSIAILIAGLSLGSALTPPAISWLMVSLGWRQSFYVASVLAFVMAIVWLFYARDFPSEHPKVSSEELAFITTGQADVSTMRSGSPSWWKLFRSRNVLLVSTSYFVEGYVLFFFVFWLYTYLVDVRQFSILGGGVFASLPFIVSTVTTPFGGWVSDRLSVRIGRRWGRRFPAMLGFIASAACLWYGATVSNPYLAIAGLSLAVGMVEFTEGTYWATTVDVGGPHAGASGGIMNTVGNLGGVVSTALVPVLVKYFGWPVAMGTGSVLAIAAALLWLGIRADEPLGALTGAAEVTEVTPR
jgi:ACS family glucarate transporter-like MFS transporter